MNGKTNTSNRTITTRQIAFIFVSILIIASCESNTGPVVDFEAPRNLTAEMVSFDVGLNWEPSLSGKETGYEILRLHEGTNKYEAIAAVGRGITSFTDSTAPLGYSIRYRVAAIYNGQQRVLSESISVDTTFNLWSTVSNQHGYNELVAYNPKTGDPITSFGSFGYGDEGIAWDGESLWIVSNTTAEILQVDPSDFNVIGSIPVPAFNIVGLTWDGDYLWGVVFGRGEVCKVDPVSGNAVASFSIPDCDSTGIVSVGCDIWVADRSDQALYNIDKTSGCIIGSISTDFYPYGLAWDGTYLWATSFDSGFNSVFRRIDLDTGKTNYKFEKGYGPHWDLAIVN